MLNSFLLCCNFCACKCACTVVVRSCRGGGDRHLVTVPHGVAGGCLPWGRTGGGVLLAGQRIVLLSAFLLFHESATMRLLRLLLLLALPSPAAPTYGGKGHGTPKAKSSAKARLVDAWANASCPWTCADRLVAIGGCGEGPNAWQGSITYLFQVARWLGAGVVEPCITAKGRHEDGPLGCVRGAGWSRYWQVPSGTCMQTYADLRVEAGPNASNASSCWDRVARVVASHALPIAQPLPRDEAEARDLRARLDRDNVKLYVLSTAGDPRVRPNWSKRAVPQYLLDKALPPEPTPTAELVAAADAVIRLTRPRPFVVVHWRVERMKDKNADWSMQWLIAAAAWAAAKKRLQNPAFVLMSDAPHESHCHDGNCTGWHSAGHYGGPMLRQSLKTLEEVHRWIKPDALWGRPQYNGSLVERSKLAAFVAEKHIAERADLFLSCRKEECKMCCQGRSTAGNIIAARSRQPDRKAYVDLHDCRFKRGQCR